MKDFISAFSRFCTEVFYEGFLRRFSLKVLCEVFVRVFTSVFRRVSFIDFVSFFFSFSRVVIDCFFQKQVSCGFHF